IQDKLWEQAVILAEKHESSEMIALFVESLNEMINQHTKRTMTGLWARIPPIIWLALFFLAVIGMGAMGYHSGLCGIQSKVVSIAAIIAFSTTLVLIIDLDRPWEGLLKVNQQAMVDLMHKISG